MYDNTIYIPTGAMYHRGIILVAYGIVKIIVYLSDNLYDLAFQYDLACGILLIVLGVIVLGCNLRIRSYLSSGLGLLILLDDVLKVQTAKDAKVFGLENLEIDIDTFHHCNCFWDLNYNKAVSGKSDQSCQYRMRFFCRRSHESSHSQGDGEDFKTNPRTGKERGRY